MPPLSPLQKSGLTLAIAQSLSISTAQAASIDVTSNLDNGTACTLRDAIATVNAGLNQNNGCVDIGTLGSNDTINFAPSVAGSTITLNGNQLVITQDVSINANGRNITLDANQSSRVLDIKGSNVSLNRLTITGGAVSDYGGGISAYEASVSLSNSTISGNSAVRFGGGIGAVYASVSLSNSTVSGNSSEKGGGISAYEASVSLSNSTISGNSAEVGGGIVIPYYGGSVSLVNSIIANSVGGNNCYLGSDGTINASTDSLSDDNSCDGATVNNNLNLDPTLTDNGGPTQTHALLAGSPAINAGLNTNCPATDQRGEVRDAQCDIGAVEFVDSDDETCFVVKAANGNVMTFCL